MLLVSAFTDSGVVYKALETGAAGFVSKESRREQIVDAVLACSRGENVVPPGRGLRAGFRDPAPQARRHAGVDSREHEILRLIAAGKSLPEIAKELYLGLTTVKTHVQHLYEKLGVRPGGGGRQRNAAGPDRVGVARSLFPVPSGEATTEGERAVAWLRLPAIALLALGQGLTHPNPEQDGFLVTLAVYSAWSAGLLAWVYLRPATERLALAATGVDIAAISMLAVLSGGAFSHNRLAFFLIPVAVAFRFRPAVTAVAVVVTVAAYVTQAVLHPAADQPEAARFIATQAGFLAWIGAACVWLSLLLNRRTAEVARLAESRSRLLADALEAEQRERKALAEALHDEAIQNLLSARHELEEAGESVSHPALERADAALTDTVGQLREAVFELHPYVLEEVGPRPDCARSLNRLPGGQAGASARPFLAREPSPRPARLLGGT